MLALPFGIKRSQQKKLIPIYDVIKSVFVCKHLHFPTRVFLSLSLEKKSMLKKVNDFVERKNSIKLKPFVTHKSVLNESYEDFDFLMGLQAYYLVM